MEADDNRVALPAQIHYWHMGQLAPKFTCKENIMIYVIMHGRMGNQFFQYSFAKILQQHRTDGISIYFKDAHGHNGESGWEDSLRHFNTGDYAVVEDAHFLVKQTSFAQKIILLLYLGISGLIRNFKKKRAFRERVQPFLNKHGLYWIINGNYDVKHSKAKNIFINGQFESSSIYTPHRTFLKNLFTPKSPPLEQNKELYSAICNSESICISIRRGDFLSEKYMDLCYLCDKRYFDRAIHEMGKRVENPVYIVFSDEIEWVKENYEFKGKVYYETSGNPVWEKLRLMNSCKHFILSNSTFSWWCQFLSANDNRIVVSPNRWFKVSDWKGLIEDSFIKIPVG